MTIDNTYPEQSAELLPKGYTGELSAVYSSDDYLLLIADFEEEIQNRIEHGGNSIDIIAMQGALKGLREMLEQVQDMEAEYLQMLRKGHFYSFYYVDENHVPGTTGDICLILDGKPTEHLIPYEDLDEVLENIDQFIYTSEGTKYEPLRNIIGDRPLMPLAWYIRLCVLCEEDEDAPATITPVLDTPIPEEFDLSKLQAFTPKPTDYLVSTIDKLTNSITSGKLKANKQKLTPIGTGKKGKGAITRAMLTFDVDELGDLSTHGNLNPFDMVVFKAVCSRYTSGNDFITDGMINETIAGERNTLNSQRRKLITDAMKKLTRTRITIDVTEEAQSYGFVTEEFKREDAMISAEVMTQSYKGRVVSGYYIKGAPLLLQYASKKKQLYQVPLSYLCAPITKNEEVIVLQDYLLDRIKTMISNGGKLSNQIRFDTIEERVFGYQDNEGRSEEAMRKKRRVMIKNITKLMDYWIGEGLITSYNIYKKGRKQEGIEVFYEIPKKRKAPKKLEATE